jgi:hypothetical protein
VNKLRTTELLIDKEQNDKRRVLTEKKLDGMNEDEIIPSSASLQATFVLHEDVALLKCASPGSS